MVHANPRKPRPDFHLPLYRALLRHALFRFAFLYFIPLLLLTLFFHVQYKIIVEESEIQHLESLAQHQAAMLDLFLGDRLLNLTNLTDDARAMLNPDAEKLREHLSSLQTTSEAFVDLAVLDGSGSVLEYVGPLPGLREKNYSHESWFNRLVAGESSHVITDVYLGFRNVPHFTMALKLEFGSEIRILRAVLSPDIAMAQVTPVAAETSAAGGGGILTDIATSIWLFSALFCFMGGAVIWLAARWVARQQYEAKRLEEDLSRQLGQSAKLALIGELAAGIAHEINNPLAVISEKAGLVKDLLDPEYGTEATSDQLGPHLDTIEKAVFRCSEITRQLLGFVRQDQVDHVVCDVNLLIDNLVDGLLGPELELGNITVVKDYDQNLSAVITAPDQLRQVVLNLLKNAADAMPASGVITIKTRKKGELFSLVVSDTGGGMSPAQRDQVFMPFYTTKAPGQGTGLGLSVSYGIIENLGGSLVVESTMGKGTSFTVELPMKRLEPHAQL